MAAPITLRLRNLHDGSLLLGEFANPDDALAWIAERPPFVQVVGVGASMDEALAQSLRAAMRPLDAQEKARAAALDEAKLAAMRDAIAAEQAAFEAETAAARAAAADADPDRPMQVAWALGEGVHNADPDDPRAVTQRASDAVLAWVAERNTWVHGRRQHLVRALVTVWPGALPPGTSEEDRCHGGGQFETEPGI
ncbi:MAG: hypothetical protein K1X88_32665 [Nannocystaceae bacterium]|nr:hypothetical protein [Nannocystaceae bacterium]